MNPRSIIATLATLALMSVLAPPATAQAWPNKPVKLIVPYPPGGGNDNLARLFAQKLGERLNQPFVVENRPGAGTLIGSELAAKASGDGYTLLLSSNRNACIGAGALPQGAVRSDPRFRADYDTRGRADSTRRQPGVSG